MRLQILDAAVRLIEEKGERALRLRDVAASAGIAEPTLYHYFPNRDALVVAAHARRYRTELAATVDPFLPAVRECESKEDFIRIFQSVFLFSFNPQRAAMRATRAEVVGSAFRREGLRREVSEAMMDSLAPTIEAVQFAQSRGWMRSDIDPRAFAIFNLSLISSCIFPEVQSDEALLDQWKRLAIEAATALVTGESSRD